VNDIVIRARDLRKVYRLYDGPGSRFLDMFGLLGKKRGAYPEHAALDGINLDIRRGEKVAFIGRNGAGKSTLLKLITKVIEPTAGTLHVEGKVHALLQIGTGFHPDFTGRENVLAYLAQLGVTGREAERKYAQIVEFAELEEYIGQPVKTYSSGMAVRLMFSTATAITPELLVLDEVLGVGDAYFAAKSYDRMRELTEGAGTTLLLVTHDVYSAVRFCERVIWLDRGRILMDGEGPLVIKAYEDSIRQQEEARLRLRKQLRLSELAKEAGGGQRAIVELQSEGNLPVSSPLYIGRIELVSPMQRHAVPLDDTAFDETRASHLQQHGSWGEPSVVGARTARAWRSHASAFHKVAAALPWHDEYSSRARLEVDYHATVRMRAAVRIYVGSKMIDLGFLDADPGEWRTWSGELRQGTAGTSGEVNVSGVHGTGAITIDAITPIGPAGTETHFFAHGDPFRLHVRYRVNQVNFSERPQILVAFHRDGVQDVCRVIARDLLIDAAQAISGEVRLCIPRFSLGAGLYTVTVMVAREGYYDTHQTQYFTLNPGVYACHTRALEIHVTDGGSVAAGTGVVLAGNWALHA
jgi:ABC-type polysaccharide/polyol phosphate transport system ATPase subunit